MYDDMFFANDNASLQRGKRRAARTETCRPCLVWLKDAPEDKYRGVAIDVNPYGACVRMLEPIPEGAEIFLQLMRDERFEQPLTAPLDGVVRRVTEGDGGFTDHGIQIEQEDIRREEAPPVRSGPRRAETKREPTRMHTIDIQIGDSGTRRTGR